MPTYQVIVYGWIEADSLVDAEAIYADGEWYPDYHELEDENGEKFDQWDIEALES